MSLATIICIDDQPEVVAAVAQDLSVLAPVVEVVTTQEPDELPDLINDVLDGDQLLALVIADQVMPGKTGVEVLTAVREDPRLRATQTCLLTGLATHEDTIRAINEARINAYIGKPWQADQLVQSVKCMITEAVFAAGLDHTAFSPVLDAQRSFELLRQAGGSV